MRPLRIAGLLLLAIALVGCGSAAPATVAPTASPTAAPSPTADPAACVAPEPPVEMAWWNDRVFYEVFVRSFQDSDGDGVGDLRGLIDRLDYLNDGDPATETDLGVTGIWLMPVFEAASYHGYDTIDYRAVEQDYGSNQDLRDLVAEAHERGIAVIVDLVLNHTSVQHPWFQTSRDPASDRADWYVWADEPPGWAGPSGQPVWHPLDGRVYYGLFWDGMPDLALTEPAVTAELRSVAESWLEAGVDGYRLDAVKHYVEEGPEQENTGSTFAWARDFRTAVKAAQPEALLVGEIWDASVTAARYVTEGAVDVAFEFELADAMVRAAGLGDTAPIAALRSQLLDLYPPGTYAAFLTNHDQNRVASELRSDPGALRVAASLLLTDPGVPFIYYGEEIGLTGRKPDERIRTPMPWDPDASGFGFSTGTPWQAFGDDPPEVSVAAQVDDADSLLAHYRALIGLRAEHAALRTGSTIPLESSTSAVSAVIRSTPEETLLVLVNLASEPVAGAALSLQRGLPCGPGTPRVLFADGWSDGAAPTEATPPLLTLTGGVEDWVPIEELPARSTVVLRLGD